MIRKQYRLTNTDLGTDRNFPVVQVAQVTSDYDAGVVTIPTTAGGTNIPIGVTTPGEAWFVNLDETNYIEIGVQVAATFYPCIRLNAGEWSPVRLGLGASALFARANTAAVDLQYHIEAV